MSKPVKVFIIMGQSNAVGLGKIGSLQNVMQKKLYVRFPKYVHTSASWLFAVCARGAMHLRQLAESLSERGRGRPTRARNSRLNTATDVSSALAPAYNSLNMLTNYHRRNPKQGLGDVRIIDVRVPKIPIDDFRRVHVICRK